MVHGVHRSPEPAHASVCTCRSLSLRWTRMAYAVPSTSAMVSGAASIRALLQYSSNEAVHPFSGTQAGTSGSGTTTPSTLQRQGSQATKWCC